MHAYILKETRLFICHRCLLLSITNDLRYYPVMTSTIFPWNDLKIQIQHILIGFLIQWDFFPCSNLRTAEKMLLLTGKTPCSAALGGDMFRRNFQLTSFVAVKITLPSINTCFPVQVRGLPGQEVVVRKTLWSGGLRGADPCSQNHHRQVELLWHRQCDHGDASPVLCVLCSVTWLFTDGTQQVSFAFEPSDWCINMNCCSFWFHFILLLTYSVFYSSKASIFVVLSIVSCVGERDNLPPLWTLKIYLSLFYWTQRPTQRPG